MALKMPQKYQQNAATYFLGLANIASIPMGIASSPLPASRDKVTLSTYISYFLYLIVFGGGDRPCDAKFSEKCPC